MDLDQRLQKIAEMEGLNSSEFDIAGAQAFLEKERQEDPKARVEISLGYQMDQLKEVSLTVTRKDLKHPIQGMIPEVTGGHTVYFRNDKD